jgi:hypothetical protein
LILDSVTFVHSKARAGTGSGLATWGMSTGERAAALSLLSIMATIEPEWRDPAREGSL